MKTVVISGASRGIGRALAQIFSANGYKVYNLSRRAADIDGVISIPTDVTDEASVISAFEKISGEVESIDIVVANAGFGISGAVEFTDTAEAKRQFDVNFFGVLNVAKAAMPHLRKSRGRIVSTSSVAAIFSIPFQSFYSASKASVSMLMSALANEARMFGVSACSVMLGDTKTGFTAARDKSYDGDDVYGGAIARSVAVMEHDEQNGASPDKVAKKIFAVATKRRVKDKYVIGFSYKCLALLQKLLPSGLVNRLIGLIYIPKK